MTSKGGNNKEEKKEHEYENEQEEKYEHEEEEEEEEDKDKILAAKVATLHSKGNPTKKQLKKTKEKISKIRASKFSNSASEFGEYEERQLNISHINAPSLESLFPDFNYSQDFSNITGFKDAMLANINYTELDIEKCETVVQRTLLRKLQTILTNNYGAGSVSRDETSMDDFIRYLFCLLKFDQWPIEVRSKLLLYLEVGSWLFATISDFVVRIDSSVYMSIVEDKHKVSKTYKNGKLKLAIGMIAAAQQRNREDETPPFTLYGIHLMADQFSFVKTIISQEYLDSLSQKISPPPLVFNWWPAETSSNYPNLVRPKMACGLPYGIADNREIIVKTLCLLQHKFNEICNQ